jgi:hypothetical protein
MGAKYTRNFGTLGATYVARQGEGACAQQPRVTLHCQTMQPSARSIDTSYSVLLPSLADIAVLSSFHTLLALTFFQTLQAQARLRQC